MRKLEKSAQTRETLWALVTQFPDLVFRSRMVLPHPRCLVISRLRGSHDVILEGEATDQVSAHFFGGAAGAVLPPSSSVSTLVLEISEQSSIGADHDGARTGPPGRWQTVNIIGALICLVELEAKFLLHRHQRRCCSAPRPPRPKSTPKTMEEELLLLLRQRNKRSLALFLLLQESRSETLAVVRTKRRGWGNTTHASAQTRC